MKKEEFKKIVKKCLTNFGFYKYKTWFCLDTPELFIGVKLDKSSFSELYYLNYGIFVKSRWDNKGYKTYNPDRAEIGSRVSYCEIEKTDAAAYEKLLNKQLANVFSPLENGGEFFLRKEVWSNPSDYVLLMSIEERRLWSPIWK